MTKVDIAALLECGNDLVDQAETRTEGIAVLRSAVAQAPNRVDALYYLAWALLMDPASGASEAEALLVRIVDETRDVTSSADSDEPSLEARARAFALAWPLPLRCVGATVKEAAEIARLADEACALRTNVVSEAARRAARMGTAWASARAGGKPEAGFEQLLAWIKAHPLHSSWLDGDEARYPTVVTTCAGLEPFFDDPSYIEWVLRHKPKSSAHPADLFLQSLCAAAGADAIEHRGMGVGNIATSGAGRRGRVLSLLALGATLEGGSAGPTVGANNPLAYAAQTGDASFVRFLVELGAPIDGRGTDVPLIAAVMTGNLDAVRTLLEAGANPSIEVTYPNGKKDSALQRAGKVGNKKEMLALLRAGKPAPPVQKKAGGLDTAPARAAWKARKAKLHKAKWADGDEDLDPFFDLIDADGIASWEAAAKHLESLDPNEMLALALVLGDLLPSATKKTKPTEITRKDHQKARIVLGDAVVKGDALLGAGTDWLVTGDLHAEGRFAHDEAARIAVGGTMTGTMVETEGELLVGGDLSIDGVVWAEYEAGTLVVAGTLKTNVLIEKDHAVIVARRDVAHRLKDTTRKVAGKRFPEAAFKDDSLDGKKLWSAISGGMKAKA